MHIFFTVTNDLTYDQRMMRICGSLAHAGYGVTLVGRKLPGSISLQAAPYQQVRLWCPFQKGLLFYAFYNIQLFFYLFFQKTDAVCANDLDTIIPCLLVSKIRNKKRIYDAHELFCEMKEIAERPRVHAFWKWIERNTVPKFMYGYTVNQPIAAEFRKMYFRNYEVIRNIAVYHAENPAIQTGNYILYQGAVNEGRCFELLIPAMQWINVPLWICGEGNFMQQVKELVRKHQLEHKVIFKGMIAPNQLRAITGAALLGINLNDPTAKSNYYSLTNRFFDYIHAGVPQVCSDLPAYQEINNRYTVAIMTSSQSSEALAKEINSFLADSEKQVRLRQSCLQAAKELNWQNEEKILINYYKQIFG